MRYLYLCTLLFVIACGPSEKEKQLLEEEIKAIKKEMAALLYNSEEATKSFANYTSQKEIIASIERHLLELRSKLKGTAVGSQEYLDLKSKEEITLRDLEIEQQRLLKMDNAELMEEQMQSYATSYDSLAALLQEKTQKIKQ